MSCPPVTPDKASVAKKPSSQAAVQSKEMPTKAKETTPLNEPSPASTYGETAGSSTNPATPVDPDSSNDITSGITQSLRAAQLDPAIKVISGSPVSTRDAKYRSASFQHAANVAFGQAYSYPPTTDATGNMNRTSPTTSPPSSGRTKAIRSAPKWRGGHDGRFVHAAHHNPDDPFVSSGETQRPQLSEASGALAYHPDKVGVTPTNHTAQAIFSPQACVFIANLTQSDTDEELEYAVSQAFRQFGNVYVKIRRDTRQMPFAFAQYTNVDDAQRAITFGRGSLFLSKIHGGPVTEEEARKIMAGYGPIETYWFASQTEREMYGLPEGIFLRFAFFDDCRNANVSFRDSATHRLEQVKGLDDNRAQLNARMQHPCTPPFPRESPGATISPAAIRHEADSHSIFIGNIPPNMTEEQLGSMFQIYGRIMQCEIIRKPSASNASGVNAFAFIEYENPHAAALAVQASPRVYEGFSLRVEHKESSGAPSRPLLGLGGSPRHMEVPSPQEVLAAFQRGVSIGMNQATHAQIMPPPVYPPYPYYPPYDPSVTAQNVPATTSGNDAPTGPQAYGSGYMAAPPGHMQYPATPAPYGHYSQSAQPYTVPNSLIPLYQWPPVSASTDNTTLGQEAR
ncbi:MAG: hypothetical protein Q9163_004238 [Psora crenata]